jgi:hypothetical protein
MSQNSSERIHQRCSTTSSILPISIAPHDSISHRSVGVAESADAERFTRAGCACVRPRRSLGPRKVSSAGSGIMVSSSSSEGTRRCSFETISATRPQVQLRVA